jgi:uncharacterized protein YkwD
MVCIGSAATYPDVVVLNGTADAETAPGFPLAVDVSFMNNGTRDAGIITVSAWLSLDEEFSDGALFLFAYQFSPLSRGQKRSVQMIDVIPPSVAPGTYYLFVECEGKVPGEENPDDNRSLISQIVVHDWDIPSEEEFCTEIAAWIFLLTNEQRAEHRLSELEWDEELYSLADEHAIEMARYRYMDHVNKAGLDATGRAKARGLETRKEVVVDGRVGVRDGIAENLAFTGTGHVRGSGYINPAVPRAVATAFISGWMKSLGHRQNILEPTITHLGVSVRKGGKYYYAAQNFR